jgi:lysophospholipase L1-like esterase
MRNNSLHHRIHTQRGLAAVTLLALVGTLLLLAVLALGTIKSPAPAPSLSFQPIEDPDGRALLNFHRSLMRTLTPMKEGERAAMTRIIHYGDSHVAADWLTGALRNHFQHDFGNGGPGFLLAGKPWPWYRREGIESGSSAGWQVDGLKQAALAEDGKLGLAGLSLTTGRAGERLWLTAECDHFELYVLKQPGGGMIEVSLDGMLVHRDFSLNSPTMETAYLSVEASRGSPHTLELRTLASGQVRVFGLVAERDQAGVAYDTLGINGARASRPLQWDWALLADQIAHRDPDLIVVAYGTNEVSDDDLDLAEYSRNFSELLHRLRQAAPRASLLVIAPPDRAARVGKRWRTISAMSALVETQRKAALASGAAFWDLFHAMGGSGTIERWANQSPPLAQADRVHLTRAGYHWVAEVLYRELLRGHWDFLWRSLWPSRDGARELKEGK